MSFYAAATIILVILMVTMSIHVLNYTGFNKKQKLWFISTFAAITFCSLAEYTIHGGIYPIQYKPILTILTVLQFAVAPCFSMLFAGALGLKHQVKIVIGAFIVCLTIGIICAPFGWVFYFNETGYHRGDYFFIYLITYVASLVYMAVVLFLVGKKFKRRDIGTIIMVVVVLAAGIIPMTLNELHVAYVSVGIAACICYVFYNDLVQQDTKEELVKNQEKLQVVQRQIITRLANLIESRDTETGAHVARTSAYVKLLAEDASKEEKYKDQIDEKFIEKIYLVSPLHDVGKIFISDKILRKPGKLTAEEFEEIKKHTSLGGEVVKDILGDISEEDYISFAKDIALYHHERWDGSGYPKGLMGEEIPLSARIMAISDVFDALVSKRCYKEAIPIEEAFLEIEKESGTHFDPELVRIFLSNKGAYAHIHDEFIDED